MEARQEKHGGDRDDAIKSRFQGWRNRHRRLPSFASVAASLNIMSPESNAMVAVDNNAMNSTDTENDVPRSNQEMSVVGPLMGVFEDLIKSSTPQVPPSIAPVGSKLDSAMMDSRLMRSKKKFSASDTSSAPKRRKGKTSTDDSRWSKRFTWPDELHREFVSAIFDIGLKNASPSAIMEFMRPDPNITSERVKSHLQKYRKNRDKSRREFLTSYDNSLQAFKSRSAEDEDDDDSDEVEGLTCGEGAAFCTHVASSDKRESSTSSSRRSSPVPMPIASSGGGNLHLPLLSAEERNGPLGHSFDCLLGLFYSLSVQLEASRSNGVVKCTPIVRASSSSQYAIGRHLNQSQALPIVEEAVDAAASTVHSIDPVFHEVADAIPHSLSEPAPSSYQGHHHHYWQAQTARGSYPTPSDPSASYPLKQAPHYQSHLHSEMPNISYSPPRPSHDPGAADSQDPSHSRSAHAYVKQYHCDPQQQPHSTPQQPAASTTKAQKESTIMKQEMRGQRAFQSKMRALMQNEINKYGGNEHGASGGASVGDNDGQLFDHSEPQPQAAGNEHNSPQMTYQSDSNLWNIENDDEIFDFLMQS